VQLGRSYLKSGMFSIGLEYFLKAVELCPKTETSELGMIYNNIGDAFFKKGGYKDSLDYYQKSLGILIKTQGETHQDIAGCFNQIGSALLKLKEYDQAAYNFKKEYLFILKLWAQLIRLLLNYTQILAMHIKRQKIMTKLWKLP
jgi:tetratricopeptide (TPR) repeat protein